MSASASDFRFASTWTVGATPERVLDVLRDVETWPNWWPQVRAVQPHDDRSGLLIIRSLLPLTLRVTVTAEIDSPELLKARLDGDLIGWTQFAIRPSAGGDSPYASASAYDVGTVIEYSQVARIGKRGWAQAARFAKPVLVANHIAMMRAGRNGLRRQCAAA